MHFDLIKGFVNVLYRFTNLERWGRLPASCRLCDRGFDGINDSRSRHKEISRGMWPAQSTLTPLMSNISNATAGSEALQQFVVNYEPGARRLEGENLQKRLKTNIVWMYVQLLPVHYMYGTLVRRLFVIWSSMVSYLLSCPSSYISSWGTWLIFKHSSRLILARSTYYG
jgi:hypothetical protein